MFAKTTQLARTSVWITKYSASVNDLDAHDINGAHRAPFFVRRCGEGYCVTRVCPSFSDKTVRADSTAVVFTAGVRPAPFR
ncbi:hypothetical protein KCP70_23260 [Salmonella enterica subsp. enterica]|nr:hypothetical protein KCP70_23260 [Salmonella enterica subsp. enterica]